MKVSLLFAVSLITLAIGDELQTEKQKREINEIMDGKVSKNQRKRETKVEDCNAAKDVSVHSAYVSERFIQLFIENLDGSRVWTVEDRLGAYRETYPSYFAQSNLHDKLGRFVNMDRIPKSQELKNDGKFKRVSASFIQFSDSTKEKAYLVMGLNAYEFEIEDDLYPYYQANGNVKPITEFFKEGDQKLLKPEDKLEEVVSVAVIKWVEKDKIKDHAIYKIILKTVTKKLVKAYFNVTSNGEFTILNGEHFISSVEQFQDEDEFNLLEESALYFERKIDRLSIGYQFTSKFGFPIYYDYNPEARTYKEYPMRIKEGFNAELETFAARLRYWSRYIVPTEIFLGCPDLNFCLGRSFNAVFFSGNQYYAIFDDIVYTIALPNNRPGDGVSLRSLFPILMIRPLNAAFAIRTMAFFIDDSSVDYMNNITEKDSERVDISEVFPGIRADSVSAVITLGNGKEADEDIPKALVYVYTSTKDSSKVYQFKMETTKPPKFKEIAHKTYNEVNAALPMHISLAFTAEGKVVTMFHHFMIEQSSQTFFTQTENDAKFTLVDKYFGCQRESLEKVLTKDFVHKYVEFAAPKPGENVFAYTTVAPEKTESITVNEGKNEGHAMSTQIPSASFIIQLVVMTLLFKMYFN